MIGKSREHSESDRLSAAEAARWQELLEQATPEQREEFTHWVTRSPTHVREYLLSHCVDAALSRFDPERKIDVSIGADDSNVVPFSVRSSVAVEPAPTSDKRTTFWRTAAAAAAVIVAGVVTLFYVVPRDRTQVYETSVGEQRTVSLADGSVVALNSNTRLEVRLQPHERNLRLDHGQAMFTVAHDTQRPFRVAVSGVAIRAVGTKFDVRRVGDQATVAVVEGRVQIEPTEPQLPLRSTASVDLPPLPQLSSGQGITILQGGELTPPSEVDIATVSAWQDRRLIFEERSLADVADDFAAYSRKPRLIIEGEALRARLYTGTFDADRPESFVKYLERDPSIEIVRSEDRVIIRSAVR